jgi:GNAT superfamily N-acetyltransferase
LPSTNEEEGRNWEAAACEVDNMGKSVVACSGVQVTTDFAIILADCGRFVTRNGGDLDHILITGEETVPRLLSIDVSDYAAVPDSVRLALPAEALTIARIQRRGWEQRLDPVAASMLAEVALDAMVDAWHRAITRPPAARYRVLVALAAGEPARSNEGGSALPARLVGFAATVPCADADAGTYDGEIEEFVIDPPAQRHGHGSRLLQACVDTLRADRFNRAYWWLSSDDDPLRAFATGAGWAPDGAWREIGPDDDEHAQVRLKQVRLHTDIAV